jgi:hypothetical protein
LMISESETFSTRIFFLPFQYTYCSHKNSWANLPAAKARVFLLAFRSRARAGSKVKHRHGGFTFPRRQLPDARMLPKKSRRTNTQLVTQIGKTGPTGVPWPRHSCFASVTTLAQPLLNDGVPQSQH